MSLCIRRKDPQHTLPNEKVRFRNHVPNPTIWIYKPKNVKAIQENKKPKHRLGANTGKNMSDKSIVMQHIQKILKLKNNLICKWEEYLTDISPKRIYRWQINMKGHSVPYVIGWLHIKILMRHHYCTCIRKAKSKTLRPPNVGEDVEQCKLSLLVWIHKAQPLWKAARQFFTKSNIQCALNHMTQQSCSLVFIPINWEFRTTQKPIHKYV